MILKNKHQSGSEKVGSPFRSCIGDRAVSFGDLIIDAFVSYWDCRFFTKFVIQMYDVGILVLLKDGKIN